MCHALPVVLRQALHFKEMKIRKIQESELDQLLSLYRHLHEDESPPPARERILSVWKEIKANPNLNYIGAFDDENLVSSCTLTIIPNLTRSCRSYGLIENVVTHPTYRRRGIGKRVLSEALKYAWSSKCYKVMLMTGRKDDGTYRFYESAGFDRNSKEAFIAKNPN